MSDQLPRKIARLLHMGEGTVVAFDERTLTAIEDILVALAPNLGATSAAPFERRVREIEAESRGSVEAAKRKTGPKNVARILQHPRIIDGDNSLAKGTNAAIQRAQPIQNSGFCGRHHATSGMQHNVRQFPMEGSNVSS